MFSLFPKISNCSFKLAPLKRFTNSFCHHQCLKSHLLRVNTCTLLVGLQHIKFHMQWTKRTRFKLYTNKYIYFGCTLLVGLQYIEFHKQLSKRIRFKLYIDAAVASKIIKTQWENKTTDQCFMDLHWPQRHAKPHHIIVFVDFLRIEYKQVEIFFFL